MVVTPAPRAGTSGGGGGRGREPPGGGLPLPGSDEDKIKKNFDKMKKSKNSLGKYSKKYGNLKWHLPLHLFCLKTT